MQTERRGTAHAVLAARAALARNPDDVLVIFGDTPLIRPQTLARMRDASRTGPQSWCSASGRTHPTGYGRLVLDGDELVAIREELDASPAERAIGFCNGGLMAFAGKTALAILDRIGNDNRKGEFYLTDAVAVARDMKLGGGRHRDRGGRCARHQHQGAARRNRSGAAAAPAPGGARAGVTLVAPETVFLVGRYEIRPRRGGRAVRGVRTRRHRRGQAR